jgi:hypothetical protein
MAPPELVLPATNRRGRPIECRVRAAPLRQGDQVVGGVILLMEEAEPKGGGKEGRSAFSVAVSSP